jgi:hypothetical protein
MAITLIALLALAAAGFTLFRLSRLPERAPEIAERTFATLARGDVVLVPEGDYVVDAREPLSGAQVFALHSGRQKRWLLVPESGPLALLAQPPESADVERASASQGGKKLDRATVELLPGA